MMNVKQTANQVNVNEEGGGTLERDLRLMLLYININKCEIMSSGGRGDAGERFAWHGAETITGSAAAVTSEGRLIISLRKRSVAINLNPSITIKLKRGRQKAGGLPLSAEVRYN